jgi:hypothetical protein
MASEVWRMVQSGDSADEVTSCCVGESGEGALFSLHVHAYMQMEKHGRDEVSSGLECMHGSAVLNRKAGKSEEHMG